MSKATRQANKELSELKLEIDSLKAKIATAVNTLAKEMYKKRLKEAETKYNCRYTRK